MYISELLIWFICLGVCSASHTFDSRRGDNESSHLLKRLETLETKQKNDGVRMRKLEADFHRQSGIIEEQNKKIDNLEKTVVKLKSTLGHAFRIARNNRRKISLMRPGLLNMDLFASGRAHHRLQGDPWSQKKMHSSIKSSITLSKPEGNIKSFNVSTSGRQHNGKTNKPNTNHHPHSQNHKAVISNHHQQHSHTDKADKSNHHQQHSHTEKADKPNHHQQHSHTNKEDKSNHHQQHSHTDTADKSNHHHQHSHTDKTDTSNHHQQHSHTGKADKSNHHQQHSHTDTADKADKSNHHQQHSHTVKAYKSNHHQQHLNSQKKKTDTSSHRQQHVHSQTENGTNGSKHVHNSDRTPSHGSRNNYQLHHKQTQSIPKHTNSRMHKSENTILSTVHHKHNGGSTSNSHGKDNQVHHHGKHTNEHNGHHSSDSASANHHNKHQSENQETRHAVPSKPRQQRRSMKTSRQSFGGIAFSVYLDHDATISRHETVKFNKIITNDGDGYDPMTGVFTCAEAGVYMLTFSIGQRDQDHYMWAELMVNSQNLIDAAVDTYHPSQDLQGGNTVLVRLHQGDKVWIDATHNGSHVEGSGNLRLTTFSGLFLYA